VKRNQTKTAPFWLKRQYLGLFWDKFMVQDKQIQQAVPTHLILRLQEESKVLIRKDWLRILKLVRTFFAPRQARGESKPP